MAERPEFQQRQYEFAAHIRDPENNPAPAGIEDRRMAIYRDLFFGNLSSLLAATYPVLNKIYDRAGWRRLVRGFMRDHRARTPLFLEVPDEFLAFLTNEYEPGDDDPPFYAELAHYEWVELKLAIAPDPEPDDTIDPDGDLLGGVPVLSPLSRLLSYRFPVHRISPDFKPDAPSETPTCLVMYRKADDELGFLEINPVTALLLERLAAEAHPDSARDLLESLAAELGYEDPTPVVTGGHDTLRTLHSLGIVLGTRRAD